MKKLVVIPGLMFVLFCFSTCKKPGCLGSAGSLATESRQLSSFNELKLADNINLELIQDSTEKIELEAPQNILSNITTVIDQNILTVSNTTDCRWARNPKEKVTVRLHFKDLKKFDYRGSGSVTNTDTLKLDAFLIESNTGAGDISLTLKTRYTGVYIYFENASVVLHGNSETVFSYINNRGIADMSDFIVNKMVIEHEGLSDTHVNVTDELSAVIFHKGNIYYKGSPVITRSIFYSTGRLLPFP